MVLIYNKSLFEIHFTNTIINVIKFLDDKTSWAQYKWISWWFFLLVSMFPYYGVQPFFFVFIFFMIDKTDEYQLVKYILDFKKMIFVTAGVENGMIGYVLYFVCATLNEYKTMDDYKK